MSKNTKTPLVGYGAGYVVSTDIVKVVEGRVLTIVEALGMKETQEKSAKDLMRAAIWNVISENSFWIDSDTHTKLMLEWESHKGTSNVPIG